jgi:hypothetical protein
MVEARTEQVNIWLAIPYIMRVMIDHESKRLSFDLDVFIEDVKRSMDSTGFFAD